MSLTLRGLVAAHFSACFPGPVWAGMPSFTLTDVAALRLQTISFFLVVFLASAWIVQLLWNSLRKDFGSLPRLTYCKALAVVGLWGLLFVLVLTMISGARELMTPGAWEKQGLTYKLATPPTTPPATTLGPSSAERSQKLRGLRDALWSYAQNHDGRMPSSRGDSAIPAERWYAPGLVPIEYAYIPGQTVGNREVVVAYEPDTFGNDRLVLFANGDILLLSIADIRKASTPEGAPK